jgi:hypothetical protein
MKLPSVSPAMSVSVVALVVALGGTSYAAASINGNDIKAKSINSSKIKKDSLGSGVIKDGKIQAKDLAPGVAGKTRWALIGANGQIALQSGGFTVVAGYPTLPNTAAAGAADNSLRANGNVYINAGEDLAGNGLGATLTLQNTSDVDGGGMAGRSPAGQNGEFSGEVTISRCNPGAPATPPVGPTNCAPADAQNVNSFVVSPRNSDGTVTTDGARKSFYVFVTS